MRKDALLLTAGAVLLLMCADAKATEIKLLSHPEIPHSDIPTDCPVLVSIMGNGHHYKRVNSYVSASTVIAEATGYSWGKEGEFALCLQVDGWGAARSVFEVLKAMLPKGAAFRRPDLAKLGVALDSPTSGRVRPAARPNGSSVPAGSPNSAFPAGIFGALPSTGRYECVYPANFRGWTEDARPGSAPGRCALNEGVWTMNMIQQIEQAEMAAHHRQSAKCRPSRRATRCACMCA